MSIAARPCPFCGGPPVLYFRKVDSEDSDLDEAYVFCHSCGAQGPTIDPFWEDDVAPTQQEMGIAAVRGWNTSDQRNADCYEVELSTFDESTGQRQEVGR